MSMLTSLLPLIAMASPASQASVPKIPREFRGVWIATVANIDWPSKPGLPTAQQQAELLTLLDKAAAMNLNAIVLQVRPATDALYQSKYEPWSEYLTGRQGRAPSPMWDPLQFAIEAAHERGMELHCWFNPYRSLHPSQKGPVASRHISRTHPRIVKSYGKHLWMDPGEPEVQKRSLDVMLDVVKRYDVDGIHIDDYFYPYKERGADGKLLDFPDDDSYGRYRSNGGRLGRDDWRRKNVDDFIERLYKGIKTEKPWVKFGISPFGIYRPGHPPGIQAGVDQYADLYADARKWLVEGWVDYYTPQLYWPIKQTPQSYPVLLEWWLKNNPKGRHMWPGNFTSRTNPSDGNWPSQEVVDQIKITRQQGAGGNVHFSMKAFSQNFNGVVDALRTQVYTEKALVPASPWLDSKAPNAPRVTVRRKSAEQWDITYQADRDRDVRFFAVAPQVGDRWMNATITSDRDISIRVDRGTPPQRLAVIAVDRAGNESAPTIVELR